MSTPAHLRNWFLGAALAVLTTLGACGGGSDDPVVVPTGTALANVSFSGSDGYYALDKLKSGGGYFIGNEADFGPRNPAYRSSDKTRSMWAVDGSASVPTGNTLSYSFKVEGVNVDVTAIAAMTANLRINTQTGLLTQACGGFPDCYDNATDKDQDFKITITASVVGGKGSLARSFNLRVVKHA
jgi:hypothetical protein